MKSTNTCTVTINAFIYFNEYMMPILKGNKQDSCPDSVSLKAFMNIKGLRATSHWHYFSKLVLQYHEAVCCLVHQLKKQQNYVKI